jgi:hypothetical protein
MGVIREQHQMTLESFIKAMERGWGWLAPYPKEIGRFLRRAIPPSWHDTVVEVTYSGLVGHNYTWRVRGIDCGTLAHLNGPIAGGPAHVIFDADGFFINFNFEE